jgi:hypothetical protein
MKPRPDNPVYLPSSSRYVVIERITGRPWQEIARFHDKDDAIAFSRHRNGAFENDALVLEVLSEVGQEAWVIEEDPE